MEQIHADSLARAVGVANFYPERLVDLIEHNDVTPAVDQIETNPFFQRDTETGDRSLHRRVTDLGSRQAA